MAVPGTLSARQRAPQARAANPGAAQRPTTTRRNGRLELVKFHAPPRQSGAWMRRPNTPGNRHIAAVEEIDAVVAGLRARGAKLVGELERYEDSYRLCYVRGPEGIIIELAEQIG
jgi:catechol 2,3-dioxygenase-like lactoylglutathione lyase family enzyme